ncbi:MAG: hypothetical protein IJP90_13595 [Treponema sp.]|nr:hypothetical protein [Treponema sp.]
MAVENLIETRLKDPKKDLYDKANDKYGYNIALGGDNKIMSEESKKLI